MDGVTSLIRGKWQPACFAVNLKLIRYKRALTSALVKFSYKTSYFHFFLLVLDSVKPQIKSWFRSLLRHCKSIELYTSSLNRKQYKYLVQKVSLDFVDTCLFG